MSKNTPSKIQEKSLHLQKNNLSLDLREARQGPVVQTKNSLPLVAMYKDLSLDPNVQLDLKRQRQHLLIAFVAFFLLGFGMFLGSYFSKNRGVAAVPFKGFPIEGTPSVSEHYQYDKSCYTGDNGEQVCMTRTSQKR